MSRKRWRQNSVIFTRIRTSRSTLSSSSNSLSFVFWAENREKSVKNGPQNQNANGHTRTRSQLTWSKTSDIFRSKFLNRNKIKMNFARRLNGSLRKLAMNWTYHATPLVAGRKVKRIQKWAASWRLRLRSREKEKKIIQNDGMLSISAIGFCM